MESTSEDDDSSQPQSAQDDDSVIVKTKKEIRSNVLKSALKSFVIDHVSNKYEVAAVRIILQHDDGQELWLTRQKTEAALYRDKNVVAFISCLTAIEVQKKKILMLELRSGLFLIGHSTPVGAYESHLTKMFLKESCILYSCKAIRGRSKFFRITTIFHKSN